MKTNYALWIIFFILLIAMPKASAETIKINDNVTGTLEDTYVHQGAATTNFGSQDLMGVGSDNFNNLISYVKFNISSIPAGITIVDANISFYIDVAPSVNQVVSVWRVGNQTWTEDELTYNNQPGNGSFVNSSSTGTATDVWVFFNVTTYLVDAYSDGNTTISFKLDYTGMGDTRTSANDTYFATKETFEYIASEPGTEDRPNLTIRYSIPRPTITVINPANATIGRAVNFNVTTNVDADWCGLSLDGSQNVSMTGYSTTSFGYLNSSMTDGSHQVIFSCNNTDNNMNSTSRYFTVDAVAPVISILQPFNTTYENNSIEFNFTADELVNWSFVQILTENYTMTNSSTQMQHYNGTLKNGYYVITFWFNDSYSNSDSLARAFTIATLPPKYSGVNPASTQVAYTGVNQSHVFDCNWTQEFHPIDTVLFEMDGINYTTSVVSGEQRRKTIIGLGLGDHSFRWWANDTYSNANKTQLYTYTVTSQSGGNGGGGGGPISWIPEGLDACNVTIYPKLGFSGFGIPDYEMGPFRLRIYNKNITQSFTVHLTGEIEEYCEVEFRQAFEIPPFGADERIIKCTAPNGTKRGNLVITSSLGCQVGMPITITGSDSIVVAFLNTFYFLTFGDINGATAMFFLFWTSAIVGVPFFAWFIGFIIILGIWRYKPWS